MINVGSSEKIIKEHIRKELNKMNKKLKYEKINNNPNVITIDLLNGYSVIAISGENKELESYTATLYLKENSIETFRLIGCADKLIFPKEELTHGINAAILKTVSDFLDNGFLQYYIDQYEFEESLVSEGITRMEQE